MNNNKRSAAKNKFSSQEDEMLRELVKKFGEYNWTKISSNLIGRNERQCHDRWFYYLSPSVNKDPWTQEEDDLLRKLIEDVGPRWVNIAKLMKTSQPCKFCQRQMVLQKAAFHLPKGRLSHAKRPPFALRKTAFCKALNTNMLRKRQERAVETM